MIKPMMLPTHYVRINTPDEAKALMRLMNAAALGDGRIYFLRIMTVPYCLFTERPARNASGRHAYAVVGTDGGTLQRLPKHGYPVRLAQGQIFCKADLWSHKYDSRAGAWKGEQTTASFFPNWEAWAGENLALSSTGLFWVPCP